MRIDAVVLSTLIEYISDPPIHSYACPPTPSEPVILNVGDRDGLCLKLKPGEVRGRQEAPRHPAGPEAEAAQLTAAKAVLRELRGRILEQDVREG